MKKIVINGCYGGFGLSEKAIFRYCELKKIKLYPDKINCNSLTIYCKIPKEEYDKKEKESLNKHGNYKLVNSGDYFFEESDIPRDDKTLIRVVEELGKNAWGHFAKLKIVKIPNDVDWEISEYDGFEHVAEKHRTWQ